MGWEADLPLNPPSPQRTRPNHAHTGTPLSQRWDSLILHFQASQQEAIVGGTLWECGWD